MVKKRHKELILLFWRQSCIESKPWMVISILNAPTRYATLVNPNRKWLLY